MCSSDLAKYVIEKDVENIASKHIFARWQAILSVFYFNIEYIKGSQNAIPNFLTREFLLLVLSKLLKPMPLTLVMVVF